MWNLGLFSSFLPIFGNVIIKYGYEYIVLAIPNCTLSPTSSNLGTIIFYIITLKKYIQLFKLLN